MGVYMQEPPANWSLLNGVVVEWSFECDACGRADSEAEQPFWACPKWYCSYSLCSECFHYYREEDDEEDLHAHHLAEALRQQLDLEGQQQVPSCGASCGASCRPVPQRMAPVQLQQEAVEPHVLLHTGGVEMGMHDEEEQHHDDSQYQYQQQTQQYYQQPGFEPLQLHVLQQKQLHYEPQQPHHHDHQHHPEDGSTQETTPLSPLSVSSASDASSSSKGSLGSAFVRRGANTASRMSAVPSIPMPYEIMASTT